MNIGKYFLLIPFFSSSTNSSGKFSHFDATKAILFHVKVFGGKTKETTLTRYFTKVTKCPNFT